MVWKKCVVQCINGYQPPIYLSPTDTHPPPFTPQSTEKGYKKATRNKSSTKPKFSKTREKRPVYDVTNNQCRKRSKHKSKQRGIPRQTGVRAVQFSNGGRKGKEGKLCVARVAPHPRVAQAHGAVRALRLRADRLERRLRALGGRVEDGRWVLVDPGLLESAHDISYLQYESRGPGDKLTAP